MTVQEKIDKIAATLTRKNATELDLDNFADVTRGFDNVYLADVLLDGVPTVAVVTVGVMGDDVDDPDGEVVISPMFVSAEPLLKKLSLPDGRIIQPK